MHKPDPKPEKIPAVSDEIVGTQRDPRLSHLDASGAAHMVDVGAKVATARRAVATAWVKTTHEVVDVVVSARAAKGDVLAAARVAGILAAKKTSELIPLCHPVQTTRAAVSFEPDMVNGRIRVTATIEAVDRTGVEMEALVAATVASLTIYDMIKGVDRWASIEGIRLEEKSGGKSGPLSRPRTGETP
ncbi:MAG: cyclic pyranopterin monophosphate synthase MoaC [Polyangiaceae bacterium]